MASAALDLLRARHRLRGIVVAGDMNVEFAPLVDSGVLGDCLWPVLRPHFTERQDMVLQFCTRHGLVHGPSHFPGDALERWTREAWGANAARSSLDHLLASRSLRLVRWAPWPAADFARRKRHVWGDHRPILVALALSSDIYNFDLITHSPHARTRVGL